MKQLAQTRMSRQERTFLLIVMALALALRLLYHGELRGHVLTQYLQLDEQFHERWAKAIAAGDVVGEGVFFRAPLYPYLLAVLYALFDHAAEVARILQHLAGVAVVLLVYVLARSLFGVRAAMLGAILAATYAVMIAFEGRLLFDFPVTFLTLLWLTLAARTESNASWHRYLLLGFLFGLICTMRPTFLPLVVPLFGSLLWMSVRQSQTRVRYGLLLLVAFLLPVGAVTLRNAVVGGDAVVIASQGGINFYIGNNSLADGMTPAVPELGGVIWENRQAEFVAEKALGRPVRPSEVSSFWYAKAWEFIRNEPWAFIRLTLKKLYLFWSHIEIKNNLSFYAFERASIVLSILPVGFWLVGPLGLAGAVLAWKNERRSRLLTLFIITYCLVIVAFFVCDRFRLPVVPVLCVFAGYAIDRAIAAWRARDHNTLVRMTLMVAGAALLVNTNLARLRPDIDFGEEELRAQVALQNGDFASAAELFGRIATLDPENFGARVNQGIALWNMGRLEDAAAALRAGIGADPYPAVLNLAHLYFTLHRLDSSYAYAERAIAARPFAPGGYVIAARCLAAQRHYEQAEQTLKQGSRACGQDFIYGEYLLAGLYLQQGKLSPADSVYRHVLHRTAGARQPEYMFESERSRYGEDLRTVHARSLHALGIIFGMRGRLDSSEVYLREAAHRLPARADIVGDWGVCLMRLNRLQEADSVMQRALQLNPGNAALWFNYGTLSVYRGKLEQARSAVRRALDMKKDFPEAQRLLLIIEAQLASSAPKTK
jgi:4-amino-4-deoxy-L-arabinose transferase-like glycosyltransferase